MPIVNENGTEEEIVSFLKRQSGKRSIGLDDFLYKDIGIYGSDGVDLANDLENRFQLDLVPLIEASTTYLPPNWLDRLLGRRHGSSVTDLRVRELVDYILAHKGSAGEDATS